MKASTSRCLEDARDVTRAKDMQEDEFEAKAQVSALKLANLSKQSRGKQNI
jgi:hypothetical protein